MKRGKLRVKWMWLLTVVGVAYTSVAGEYKDPFRTYNRKIEEYSKKSSSGSGSAGKSKGKSKGKGSGAKMLKLDWPGKIKVQERMKEAKYAQLQKEYEKDRSKIEKFIESKEKQIEKYPDKKDQVGRYRKLIEKYKERLSELDDDFVNGVEVFYTASNQAGGKKSKK